MSIPEDYILKCSAGPDYDNLTVVDVNDEQNPLMVNSPHFTGYLLPRILDFNGLTRAMQMEKTTSHMPIRNPASGYFEGKSRRYSLCVQGRFKDNYDGDQVVFGIDSNRPLAPVTGISMALRISRWLDPTLEADLSGDCPHMYSPIVSGINSLAVFGPSDKVKSKDFRTSKNSIEQFESDTYSPALTTYTPMSPISLSPTSIDDPDCDDRKPIVYLSIGETEPLDCQEWAYGSKGVPDLSELLFDDPKHAKACRQYQKRKSYLSKLEKRKQITIKRENIYALDFYDCYFEHSAFQMHLPGFSINAFPYWDKQQPLRYVCKTRDGSKVFFVFQFDWVLREQYCGVLEREDEDGQNVNYAF